MLDTIYSQVGAVITLLACGFAFWRGDKLEQFGAGAVLIAWISMIFAQDDTATAAPTLLFFVIDFALMLAMGAIAWKSSHSWPIFAIAFQLIKIVLHATLLLGLHIGSFAYLSAFSMSNYGVLATLVIGTWNVWREHEALKY